MRNRNAASVITQLDLFKVLSYDPETGVFTWLRNPNYPAKWNTRYAGKPAGAVMPKGYRIITVGPETHYAHRLAWLWVHGVWPPDQIDHRNRNRDDNRIDNLRLADNSQNNINTGTKPSKSGVKGVQYYPPTDKWRARINLRGREIYLGYFLTKEEAVEARRAAVRKYHGEFADVIALGD